MLFVALVGLAGGFAGLAMRAVDGRLERSTVDVRFAVRGDRAPSRDVVVIALDNDALRRIGRRPPIDRRVQAKVIDRLDRAGAKVVAFDYSLEGSVGNAQDIAIVQALYNTRAAVVSVTAPSRDGGVAPLAGVAPFERPVRPGYTGLHPDPQGVVRTFARPSGPVPLFSVAAAEALVHRALRVPRGALIDFPGPSGTVPEVPYASVLTGAFDPSAVAGRIAIVGSTATVLADRHRVPVSSAMPGPEIHADSMATALAGFPLRAVSAGAARRTTVALGFVVPLLLVLGGAVARRRRPARLEAPDPLMAAALAAAAVLAWLLIAQVAFDAGHVVDLLPGSTAILAAGAVAAGLGGVLTARERRQLRTRFAAADLTVVSQTLAARRRRRVVDGSDVIPGYVIVETLAAGGMGVVYRARQQRLDREIALKLIRQEHAADAVTRSRFVEEAYKASAVAHPNIMPVVDAGESGGVLFIAMPFVRSRTLAAAVGTVGGLPADWALPLLHRVACALDAAYEQEGLLHRDVKPSNVLIPERSPMHPYVIDFGVAAVAGAASVGGTPGYLAPEGCDSRSGDVYALAVTLTECLAGHRLAPGELLGDSRPELAVLDDLLIAATGHDPGGRSAPASALTRAAAERLGIDVVDDGDGPRGDGPRAAPSATPDVPPTEVAET